jgi:hypothetical protein
LAKPIDPTMSIANLYSTANPLHVVDGEFQPAVAKPKPPIQEIQLIRRGNFNKTLSVWLK